MCICGMSIMMSRSLSLCCTEMMPSKWGLVMNRLIVLFRKFSDTLTQIQVLIWRVLELHILKMVAFFVVWVALGEVSSPQQSSVSLLCTV